MEDSEINSASSNLRDLIMQKLSAAREQKLKQNRNSGNFTGSKVQNNWEEEKQSLFTLIEKLKKSNFHLAEEKKNLESLTQDLAEKNRILSSENKELKIEQEKFKGVKPDKAFLEEQKRLENICADKEKKLKEEAKKNLALEEKIADLSEALKEEKTKKLNRHPKALEKGLTDSKQDKEKPEKSKDEEISKLKISLVQLKESKDAREKELKEQLSSLIQENLAFKKKTDTNKREETEPAKSDSQKMHENLTNLEASLEKIKDDPESKSTLTSISKDFSDFYAKQKTVDELHFSELIQKNGEISALQNEVSELRHRLIIFESKKYENELASVRSDLHKAIAERMHAKKLIICYIKNVQQLEKLITDRLDPETFSQVSCLEISRLNEENKNLVEAKSKDEEFYSEEIRKLQAFIECQNSKIKELESKVDFCQRTRVKENNEEMKSWIVRNRQLQEVNKKLVDGIGLENKAKKRGVKESVKIH